MWGHSLITRYFFIFRIAATIIITLPNNAIIKRFGTSIRSEIKTMLKIHKLITSKDKELLIFSINPSIVTQTQSYCIILNTYK